MNIRKYSIRPVLNRAYSVATGRIAGGVLSGHIEKALQKESDFSINSQFQDTPFRLGGRPYPSLMMGRSLSPSFKGMQIRFAPDMDRNNKRTRALFIRAVATNNSQMLRRIALVSEDEKEKLRPEFKQLFSRFGFEPSASPLGPAMKEMLQLLWRDSKTEVRVITKSGPKEVSISQSYRFPALSSIADNVRLMGIDPRNAGEIWKLFHEVLKGPSDPEERVRFFSKSVNPGLEDVLIIQKNNEGSYLVRKFTNNKVISKPVSPPISFTMPV